MVNRQSLHKDLSQYFSIEIVTNGQHEHKIKVYVVYSKVLIREEEEEQQQQREQEDHCNSKVENSERFHQLKPLLSAIQFLTALNI